MSRHVRILTGCIAVTVCVGALAAACGGGGGGGEGAGAGAGAGGGTSSGNTTTTTTTEGTGAGTSAGGDAGTTATAPTPPPPPPQAHVRVIHASPDPAAATVAVFLDNNTPAAIPSLAFKAVAGYVDLPAAAHHVAIRPASAAATTEPVLQGETPALEANHHYTVIAHGLAASDPRLALASLTDDADQPEAGHAYVRFFHALAGLGAVDVCMPGATARAPATPVFTNVAYGSASANVTGGHGGYANVPTGHEIRLQVRRQHARPCTGAVVGAVTVNPADRSVVTAVAVGRAGGTPAVAHELLVCTDAPTAAPTSQCNAVPIAAH